MTALLVLAAVAFTVSGALAALALRRDNPDNPVLVRHPFGQR